MTGRAPAILDHLTALSDPTRSRILLLLDRHELTVSELCSVIQLPQSTVSRHLKALVSTFAKKDVLRKDVERLLKAKGPGACK